MLSTCKTSGREQGCRCLGSAGMLAAASSWQGWCARSLVGRRPLCLLAAWNSTCPAQPSRHHGATHLPTAFSSLCSQGTPGSLAIF
jgi:hypothetical protein